MRNIFLVAVVAILVAIPMSLWSAANGAQLYKDSCAGCHGDKGEGNTAMNMPAVAGAKGTKKTADQIKDFLLKGETGKTMHAGPFGDFNEEKAKAVADFVKSIK
jgi:cytochrome c553